MGSLVADGKTIRVRVRCFALAADLAGGREIDATLPAGATVADLMTELSRRSERFAGLAGRMMAAVGQDYVAPERRLAEGDEVAIIPPVSGGGLPPDAPAPDRLADGGAGNRSGEA
jgi:molybdopterin synthase catalytic subunit